MMRISSNVRDTSSQEGGMSDWLGAAISGVFGLAGQERQNAFNSAQASNQMDFQRHMSNTAHQREVQDLSAAGLNPILSGMGGAGASTPGGAMTQMTENPAMAVANSALAAMDLKFKNAEIDKTEADKIVSDTQAALNRTAAEKVKQETNILKPKATIMDGLNSALQYLKQSTEKYKLKDLPKLMPNKDGWLPKNQMRKH